MLIILMILGGIFLRLVPHIPNFAPISAICLFGGVYLQKRYALIVPLAVMVISDYLLGLTSGSIFHSTTLYVWGSFVVSGVIGIWLKKNKSLSNIIVASFLTSIQFFLITNFGVWQTGMYDRSLNGLMESYIMGIPFFKWTLLGDLFYTFSFFATFELAKRTSFKLNLNDGRYFKN